MRELIRHILKENRLQQELKQFIEDNNIFDAAEMVGGLDNLKSIFKDDLEVSKILDELTGVVDFEMYYDGKFKSDGFVVFPIKYEIIGIGKNIWGTHSWPELNLIYDDSKLTSVEKNKLITIISVIQNDNTVGKLKTKSFDFGKSTYFDVTQINGNDVDIHDYDDSFSIEDVERIHDKLYGDSESLNESINSEIDKNLRAINILLSQVSWEGLCNIWVEYNPVDKDYEIRSKTMRKDYYLPYLPQNVIDEMITELNFIEESIKNMGLRPYVFSVSYVDNCEDEVEFMNESSNESEKDTKKLFKITKMIMEDLILPSYNHIICSYEITLNEVFNIPEVTVLFIGGYGTKLWPMTQGIKKMYLDVLEDISKEIANYTGVVIGVRGEQTPKCNDEENIYLKESESKNKEYSPAGKEVTPREKVYHQSNPMFRNKIQKQGLRVRAGECYKIYAGYGEKCIPAIFATNSSNKKTWFDSSYDDDVWEIDTTKIPNVKWYKDRHYESRSKHIVTFQDIPEEAIKLIYEGSGKDSGLMESENKSEDKKLELVKEMIYSFFDEVEFIEVDTHYQGKPLIKIYHDVEDTAANYDNWLSHEVQDKIMEITGDGIILSPWWALGWDWKYKNVDFYINVQKIEYDDEGNVINESEESKQERKFNKLIQNVEDYLNSNEYPSVKKFTVYYEDTHDDVIVNLFFNVQDSIRLGGGINSVIKRVGKQVMKDLEVFPLSFKYYIHFDRDINESKKKSTNELIITVLNTLVLPQYEHVICGFELKNVDDKSLDNIINYPGVTVTFIGGYGTKMWPQTQAVKKMYNDVLDDIWETVWDYTGVSLELYSKYVKDCGKENIYLREQKEKQPKYLNIIKDIVEPFKYEDCVCDIRVLYNEEDDMYLIDLNLGTEELNDKFIAVIGMNHYVSKLRRDIKETIKDYLPIDNFYVGSYASPNCKWKPLNESDNKEKSLVKLIEKDGLYNFIEMSGLDFNQVKSILNKMDNPKEILKQYIREYVLEYDGMSSENSGSLFGLKIRLSNTKLIYDIMVQDSDQIAVEIWEFYEDNYGQRITKDQYLTTINSLTNEELLSILSWMIETIQIGYWD